MNSEQSSGRPAYLRLRDALVQRIATGEWGAGKSLPAESTLAREFKVSCETVRAALDVLECERVVMRKPGRGTVVMDVHCSWRSSRSGRDEHGLQLASKTARAWLTEGLADKAERDRLQLRSSDRVYRIHRTRSSKGRPTMIERVVLPAALFSDLAETVEFTHTIVDLAAAYGLRLGQARERISSGVASPSTAAALGLDEGSSVLVLDRVVMTRDGRPAEWRIGECGVTLEDGLSIPGFADEPIC